MKKIIALVAVIAFTVVLAGMVFAVDNRSAADKLDSGRAYLKLLDAKIVKHRNLGNAAVVKDLQAQKKSTIARMKVWKAEAQRKKTPVAPVAPPPPPVVVRPAPSAPSAGLFGLGINTGYTGGYIMGNSVIAARADLILGDALGIGPMLGLSEDTIGWKVGLGYAMGNDINDNSKKAIPLFVDGIINIPADLLFGYQTYISGGLNYVLYGSESVVGSYGGQISYGLQGDIGLGGDSYAEVGYTLLRSGSALTTPYSMRGISINVGTQLVL